jgi:uncharacterized membrane protein
MFDIGPSDYGKALAVGLAGYAALFVMSVIFSFIMVNLIGRRAAKFMLLTFGMFTEFMVIFYGINIGVPYFTDLENTVGAWMLFVISVVLSLIVILFTASYLRWVLSPESSPYERENEALAEEELAQFDINRREYMKRRKEITGRGKGL